MVVRINPSGFDQVAKSREIRAEVNALAERVADNARSQNVWVEGVPGDVELPIEVVEQTTDRARASVQIQHPSGLAVQAKHGILTRAAAAAGLEVKS